MCSIAPISIVGRAVLGAIILMVLVAATYTISGSIEAVIFVAIIAIGIMGAPFCSIFPLRYTIISVGILALILIADAVQGR
jgi:hypothetical protein